MLIRIVIIHACRVKKKEKIGQGKEKVVVNIKNIQKDKSTVLSAGFKYNLQFFIKNRQKIV